MQVRDAIGVPTSNKIWEGRHKYTPICDVLLRGIVFYLMQYAQVRLKHFHIFGRANLCDSDVSDQDQTEEDDGDKCGHSSSANHLIR
jgi:hypothetical protein